MSISSNFRLPLWAALSGASLMSAAWAQGIPNPLVRPERSPAAAASTPDPQARGATAAPQQRPAAARGEGEGLPTEDARQKTPSEQLASFYVSAVIGDRAVLRSTDVRNVPPLTGGGAAGGGSTGSSGTGGGGGAGGGTLGVGGLRSQVYVVRNGEVLPFLDNLRLLVRVRDTTVTLFDVTNIPPGNYDPLDLMDRGFPVAFRGSVDSVQALPPTPAGLIGPGQGLDGSAFERGRNTTTTGSGSRIGSGGGSGGSTGNSSGNTGNP